MNYRTVMHEDGTLEKVPIERVNAGDKIVNTELTVDERRALTDEKLNYLLQTADGALLLSVIKEAKDRDDGKPVQRLDAKLTTRTVHLHVGIMQQPQLVGGIIPAIEHADNGM